MIEICFQSRSLSSDLDLPEEPSVPSWEKIGRAAFGSFAFLGAIVFASGNLRKKKISLPSPSLQENPPPPPIEIDEPPPLPTVQTAPPQLIAADPYGSLRWSLEDRRKIGEIVSSMGQYALGEIGFVSFISNSGKYRQYERDLESIAVENEPLHPFKFLETVFGNPDLKRYMPPIFDNFFLRSGFMSGMNKGMNRESGRSNLEPYLESFCKETGVVPEAIRPVSRDRAWEKIVRSLIEAGAAREEQTCQA